MDRRDKMIECMKLVKKSDENPWNSFMYCNDLQSQGLYYGLKVMKSILVPTEIGRSKSDIADFTANKSKFYKRFNENDGFTLLCNTLAGLNTSLILKDVVYLSIYQMMLNILQIMLEDSYFREAVVVTKKGDSVKESTSKLIAQCNDILFIATENITLDRNLNEYLLTPEETKNTTEEKVNNIKQTYEMLETDFFYYLIVLIKG